MPVLPMGQSIPVSREQTRADLEGLYASISDGWCTYGSTMVIYGSGGGCLHQHLTRVIQGEEPDACPTRSWTQRKIWEQRLARSLAVIEAMGFSRAVEMHDWNDHIATWDMVKERVKDAIGTL